MPVVYNARGACGPNGSIMKCATLDFLGLVVTTVLFEIEKPREVGEGKSVGVVDTAS